MNQKLNIFKYFSEKGYTHYTENTIEELDNPSLDISDIITEFAHLCDWLRTNHDIWISVYRHDKNQFYWSIDNEEYEFNSDDSFKIPQEAYFEAFIFIQERNLIK